MSFIVYYKKKILYSIIHFLLHKYTQYAGGRLSTSHLFLITQNPGLSGLGSFQNKNNKKKNLSRIF